MALYDNIEDLVERVCRNVSKRLINIKETSLILQHSRIVHEGKLDVTTEVPSHLKMGAKILESNNLLVLQ